VLSAAIEFVRIDTAESIDRNLHDLEPELLQIADRVPDRMVFDLRDDDAVAARLAGPRRALDSQVVRLGPARGEHDLAGRSAEGARDLLVRFVEAGTRAAARAVEGRGVAKLLREVRQHRLEGFAPQRSGGGVVEIDRHRRDCTTRPRPGRMNRSSGRRARRPPRSPSPCPSPTRLASRIPCRPLVGGRAARGFACAGEWTLASPRPARRRR
jgi:hypothetical protein